MGDARTPTLSSLLRVPDQMAIYISLLWLLFIALLTFLCSLTRKQGSSACTLPPGPKKLPIIGNLHQLGRLPHRSLWQLSQRHGPLMHLRLGSMPTIVVASAEMAREVLKSHDLDFCSRPRLVAASKIFYNGLDVAFSPYNDYWRELRKTCILELLSAKRVQSFRSIREEEVAAMVEMITTSSSTPMNLSKMMVTLTNNMICRIAFGKTYGGGDYRNDRFHEGLKELQALLGAFYFEDFFPSLGWVDRLTHVRGQLTKSFDEFDALYEQVIKEHLDQFSDTVRLEHADNIVDVLLRLQKDAGHLTKDHIKGILTDIFLGGTETASTTLVWAIAELVKNLEMMKKVQEEIRVSIGPKGKVEEDDLYQLQYLKAVVKEAMRLHPPLPLLVPRESIRHTSIAGYDILPRMRVYINAWGIGRDPKSWERPEEFCPERFLNSPVDLKGQDFELIPFGSGRRICPAANLGILTIELVLANLLYCFDWELPPRSSKEDIDMEEAPGLVIHKKSDLNLMAVKHTMS